MIGFYGKVGTKIKHINQINRMETLYISVLLEII